MFQNLIILIVCIILINGDAEFKSDIYSLPIVDLKDNDEICAQKVHSAATQFGFFYLTGHEISPSLFDKIFNAAHDFFKLNQNEKLKLEINRNNNLNGYIAYKQSGINYSNNNKTKQDDTKEAFRVDNEHSKFQNQWPTDSILPNFKNILAEYRENVFKIALRLNKIIALSLGLNCDYFDKYFGQNIDTMTLVHYLPIISDTNSNRFGIGPHTDFGMFTLLLIKKENGNGLQILLNRTNSMEFEYNDENVWIDIKPIDNMFVVNIADVLAMFTNDYYVSTYHRVVTRNHVNYSADRYSITFFFNPSYDAQIECIEELLIAKNERCKYEPIPFELHLDQKLRYIKSHTDKSDKTEL